MFVNEVATGEADAIIVPSRGVLARTVHTFDEQSGRTAIQQVQATKQLGSAAGQWSVTLKGDATPFDIVSDATLIGASWMDVITDGDWVEISVLVNGEKYTLMVGRVDKVSLSLTASETGVGATTIVSGRDCGAVYEDVPIYFNPYDAAHANPVGINVGKMLGADGVLNGSPSEIASQVLATFAGNGPYGQQPDVPAGLFSFASIPFVDVVADNVSATKGTVFAASMLTVTAAGSVWEYANSFVVPQFNEMIIDTRPSEVDLLQRKAYLTIRERPFCNLTDGTSSPWFDLQPIPVNLSEVQTLSVSKGQNRVNQIQVITQLLSGMGAESATLYPPLINTKDAKRYGLRRMEQRTQHNFGIGGTTDTASPEKLRNLICHWNVLNPYYFSGMVAIARIRPDIRVGSKIVMQGGPSPIHPVVPEAVGVNLRSKDCGTALTFYVEGVQWDFTGGESPRSRTQVMVSRGYPENKRLLDIAAQVVHWADPFGIPPISGDPGEKINDIYDYNDVVDDGTVFV